MTVMERILARPHLVLASVLLFSVVGLIGYFKMPFNLFPDSERPQITVVTVLPGGAAADIENDVSRIIEKELSTLDLVRRVTSTTKDEVSMVSAEFEYAKGLDAAATDVANALGKVGARLPREARPPQLFKISQATQPVLTLALSPADGSGLSLPQIRHLAENRIREELLRDPEIANIELFGANQPEIAVTIDPERLNRFGIAIAEVLGALATQNQNIPQGMVIRQEGQYLVKTDGAVQRPDQLLELVVARKGAALVHLRDVATVTQGVQEPQSAYHGNGRQAIGLNIMRGLSGHTLDTIRAVEHQLPKLKAAYPGIRFEVSYSQQDLVERSVDNMLEALRDAIIITVLVIFLFLGNLRTMLLVGISIPFSYLLTFACMWLFGFEFHMITLTGVILAVGMLTDDSIVVIENIERHYRESGKPIRELVAGGTQEVMLAIMSGTFSTVVVLVPIIFIGGYVQTVLRPLSLSLCIALVASYIVSVTVIPILAPYLLKLDHTPNRLEALVGRWGDRFSRAIADFFSNLLDLALQKRLLFLAVATVLLLITGRLIKPLVGQDVMPPMDTGIIKISFEADANSSLEQSQQLLTAMEGVIRQQSGVTAVSSTLGSEPSVVSFGGAKNPQAGAITVMLVDRFSRSRSIWEIERELRAGFARLPGLKYVDVYEYGATPLSTIRATVDLQVTGPDPLVLAGLGRELQQRMQQVGGLASVSLIWQDDKRELRFTADPQRCALYGISPREAANQVQTFLQGGVSTFYRLPGEDSLPVRVRLAEEARNRPERLEQLLLHTPLGEVPLGSLGRFSTADAPALLTRQDLQNSINLLGYRETAAVSHIMDNVTTALQGVSLPPGYSMTQEGESKQAAESFSALMAALTIGMILLYFSLVPAFNSFLHPLTIMTAIPLALIGAIWSLLATGKHQSMGAFMGLILLAGIVVKNSILLIDFIEVARSQGLPLREALRQSVQVRTRPILMTAFGTAVGMLPIALERAIGLERLSPLAVVAIGGLLVSTFLTLIYVPIFYTLFDELGEKVRGWGKGS